MEDNPRERPSENNTFNNELQAEEVSNLENWREKLFEPIFALNNSTKKFLDFYEMLHKKVTNEQFSERLGLPADKIAIMLFGGSEDPNGFAKFMYNVFGLYAGNIDSFNESLACQQDFYKNNSIKVGIKDKSPMIVYIKELNEKTTRLCDKLRNKGMPPNRGYLELTGEEFNALLPSEMDNKQSGIELLVREQTPNEITNLILNEYVRFLFTLNLSTIEELSTKYFSAKDNNLRKFLELFGFSFVDKEFNKIEASPKAMIAFEPCSDYIDYNKKEKRPTSVIENLMELWEVLNRPNKELRLTQYKIGVNGNIDFEREVLAAISCAIDSYEPSRDLYLAFNKNDRLISISNKWFGYRGDYGRKTELKNRSVTKEQTIELLKTFAKIGFVSDICKTTEKEIVEIKITLPNTHYAEALCDVINGKN